jgi:hypothetical protein
MTPTSVTNGPCLVTRALVLCLLLSACTTVTPAPSLGPTATPAPTALVSLILTPTATPLQSTAGPTQTIQPSSVSPSQSPIPSCACSPGAGTPAPTIDPAVATQIDAVVAQVPPIRELQPTKVVPYRVITRDDFSNYLASTADEDTTPEWRAAEERFLKRMGLLAPDVDLNQLLMQLYTAEVAAYYNPDDGTFYIIDRDAPFGPVDKITTAHEYTHALQDQNFGLEALRIKDAAEGDAILSQLAVIEGDATLTSQNWMRGNLSEQEQLQLLTDALGQLGSDQLASFPLILRRQLEFPYSEGLLFASDVWGLGGYNAVNQALQTPPASTEQILHSDKYYNHEAPVAIGASDLAVSLGSGFSNVYQQTMGELNVQVLATGGEKPPIDIPGLPAQWPHAEVAAGWGGDRVNMYEGPNEAWLIDWQTAWDTQADADEFSTRIGEIQASFGGTTRVFQDGQSVRIVIASDPNLFLALPSG